MLWPMAALALLVLVPAVWAALLRWARCPGWAVVGGVVAGIVLGPTVLGRVLPERFDALFVGGVAEGRALAAIVREHEADRIVAEETGFAPDPQTPITRRRTRDLELALEAHANARWAHQGPRRIFTAALVAAMLLGGAASAVGRDAYRPGLAGALSIGGWSAVLPGGLAFFLLRWFTDAAAAEALLAAAAVGIGPWVLTAADREAADLAELGGARLIQTAGRVATVLAVGTAFGVLCRERGGLLLGVPLAAVAVGWILPAGPRARGLPLPAIRAALVHLVVPAVAASVAIEIDLIDDFDWRPIVLFLLLSGDGRWLGALAGAQVLGGRRGVRTMRLVLGSMAAGPTQLAVTAAAVYAWALDPEYALALLLGAVLIETTAPARRGMADRLIRTESALEQIDEP